MSQPQGEGDRSAVLKRALLELRDLRAKLEAAESARKEPIAIIGAGCRFPGGADTPEALWRMLSEGVDATGEVPRDRWDAGAYYDADPDAVGKAYTRRGGFLDEVDRFDERFFNMTPREARSLDPQHRLLLEVSWEALENAGLAPDRLARTRTGVFVGMSASEYASLLADRLPAAEVDAYAATGTALNFAPGRIAYSLGLQGPSLVVDTACSSSLVAVHLACQSLRSRESDVALAGGVSLMLSPEVFVVLCKMRVLAPDGRCKTFDAAADGYARGEGSGVVVLRRLSDALAAGDRVLAVILGSAVNQDGPSSGLTVPSGPAQQALLEGALAAAGVAPAEVGYVEAHGTGTPLGDPIEVRALAAALGRGRAPGAPLLIGSVKTNVGHTEASAGVAGLIKAALAVHHGEIPPHLHCRTPSPHIEWDRLGVRVATERTAFPPAGGRRIAGVSAFGASGTNAHVILEAPPSPAPPAAGPERPVEILSLSARSDEALRALADRYERHLSSDAAGSIADACHTANTGRAQLPHRLAVVAESREALRERLEAFARGELPPRTAHGRAEREGPPRVAFLFTGQGSQYVGMGRQLFETQPVFRGALEECDALLRPHLERPLLSALYPADGEASPLDETAFTQPALFALEWALAALWRSWGIEPAAVLGHSVGEYAAACVAGVFSLEDGLRLIATRGRLMQALPRDGAMAALFADEATVAEALAPHAREASIAAVNGPTETVISGARAAVKAVVEALGARGVKGRALNVSHAFHSPLLDPMLDDLARAAAEVRLSPPRIPLISNLSGQAARDELTRADYYRRHARAPVRFSDGIAALAAQGHTVFLEIGPSPVLLGMGRRVAPSGSGAWLPSLRKGREDWSPLLESLGELYVRGAKVDWAGVDRGYPRRTVALPTYPFQRQRHWVEAAEGRRAGPRRPSGAGPGLETSNALLGRRIASPALEGSIFETELDAGALPALRDHRVYGRALVSGVVHLALVAVAAAEALGRTAGLAFENIHFMRPLILPEPGARTVQTILTPGGPGAAAFQVVSREAGAAAGGDPGWTVHTAGRVRLLEADAARPAARSLDEVRARCTRARDGADFYERLWRPDEHWLGPSYRTIDSIRFRDGEALARLKLPPLEQLRARDLDLDPAFLATVSLGEVLGQVVLPAIPGHEALVLGSDQTFIGEGVDRSWDYAGMSHRAAYCHAVLREHDGEALLADVCLLDEAGEVLAASEGMRFRRVGRALVKQALASSARRAGRRERALEALLAGAPEALRGRVEQYLRDRVADIIGVAAPGVDPGGSLRDLGMDSLMTVELKTSIEADLQVPVSIADLLQGSSLAGLADGLASELAARRPAPLSAPQHPPVPLAPVATGHAAPPPAPAPAAAPPSPALDPESPWLRRLTPGAGDSPRLRLLCFPHGGAGASAYRPWLAALPPGVDVHAIQLPGREDRLREPASDRLDPLVQAIADAIAPLLDRPFALFGVSMGALLAFEVARALRRRGAPAPAHLFVAAYPAPHLLNPLRAAADQVRAAFLGSDPAATKAALGRLGFLPEALIASDALHVLLPTLRADFEAVFHHEHREEAPLEIPISALGGRQDDLVSRESLSAWSRHTSGAFELQMLPGPHLFYQTDPIPLLAAILRPLPFGPASGQQDEPIAVVGLACHFPGGARDPESFWRLLRDGVDAIGEVPEGRWGSDAWAGLSDGEAWAQVIRRGGFVEGIEAASARRFGISDAEAGELDPLQRATLEVCWDAVEAAGLPQGGARGHAGGVFVGACGGEYAQIRAARGDEVGAFRMTGELPSLLAGRVSHGLGWRGPSLVVDTAFSSALMAVHLACESLRRGECEVALAAGAHCMLSPLTGLKLWRLGVLSPDARCRTFDAAANGYVRGEGAGAVVLKRLGDALRDGDRIWAVLRGAAVTHDGRAESLLAPSVEAQEAMLRQAWARAGVAPAELGYLEAHGTGTPVGDPVEMEAIARALAGARGAGCAVGSVKTNLGHLEAAAGMAGLLKVILSLAHEAIPPHLHLRQLSPKIALEGSGIEIPTELRPWRRGGRRRVAGVSAFGMSGTNVHVVVVEGPPHAAPALAPRAAADPDRIDRSSPPPLPAVQAAPAAPAARTPRAGAAQALPEPALWAELRGAPAAERRRILIGRVRAAAARVLPPERAAHVDTARPLHEIGLDSLGAVELRGALERIAGVESSDTLLFRYPTVEALAGHLEEALREALDGPERPAPDVGAAARSEGPAPAEPLEPAAADEPIAIVGLACRFPGGTDDPDAYWALLRDGRDAVGEIPAGRWDVDAFYDPDPEAIGRMSTRRGAFLREVDRFDAAFFGISPREAENMDPQQRLLLEVAWEALERAGQPPDRLQGQPVGVFVGVYRNDYAWVRESRQGALGIDAYSVTGEALSIGPGRLSYVLGLQGPSLAVDTACSSSLVAVHLACRSLRARESDLALAGGVNLILSPEGHIQLSRVRALAPDGRCKAFDARADGYGRGEGCGIVVLKRLSDARRDGDRIWAVIRGSAVNQDGRSNGLTAPNGLAQQALLRRALSDARVGPEQIDYVEAHGTGTPLGDPIEVEALREVLGGPRPDGAQCAIGSVKASLGHLESAAGIAGLIKVVLSLRHEQIPAQANLTRLNPRIALDGTPLVISARPLPWPRGPRRRIAGVSSFGISGTNAHVVLEEAPEEAPEAGASAAEGPWLLPIAAQSPGALEALAGAYRRLLDADGAPPIEDICRTASVGRSHGPYRRCAVGATRAALLSALDAPPPAAGGAAGPLAGPVLVFPGQGSQWLGMGRRLLEAEPVFRAAALACEEAMRPHVTWSLTTELAADATSTQLGEIDVVQPALWAIQVALAALWRSWGVAPDAVIGHSMGEVAAAHVAGVLELDDAARIICRRSRLMRRVSGRGAMALVELTRLEAERALVGHEQRLSIAASNGPRSTVLSGDARALDDVLAGLQARGVFCRRVKVDVASHSPEVEGLLGELTEALAGIRPQRARVPMLSTVTGRRVEGPELDASYWAQNLRLPVQFAAGVQALAADGRTTFIEVSPHPILLPSIEDVLLAEGRKGTLVPSLRRDEDERLELRRSLGALYVAGGSIAWEALHPGRRPPVELPTYPWQRERAWIEAPAGGARRAAAHAGHAHPLLGDRRDLASDSSAHVWEAALSVAAAPYLADHRVGAVTALPAAAFAEMALNAAREVAGPGPRALEDLVLEQLLAVPETGARVVQVALRVEHAGRATFEVHSRPDAAGLPGDAAGAWTRHARGALRPADHPPAAAPAGSGIALDLAAIRARCPRAISRQEHYARMAAIGLPYGPRFQGIVEIHLGAGEALARARLPGGLRPDPYLVHPSLLDACFQALLSLALEGRGDDRACLLPVGLRKLRVFGPLGAEIQCHVALRGQRTIAGAARIEGDLRLLDVEGREVAEVTGLEVQRVDLGLPDPSRASHYDVVWRPAPEALPAEPPATPPRALLILADRGRVGEALRSRLLARGHACVLARRGARYATVGDREIELAPDDPGQIAALLRDAAASLGRPAVDGIVHLLALDAAPGLDGAASGDGHRAADADAAAAAALRADPTLGCGALLGLVQAIAHAGYRDAPRLWLVTRGAQPAAGQEPALAVAGAPLWGFGRTIQHEHPELRCALLDLDPAAPADEVEALARAVEGGGDEDQIALRGGTPAVARLVLRAPAGEPAAPRGDLAPAEPLTPAGDRPFRLEIDRPGALDRLVLRAVARRPPGPGEVEIEVAATGLNFLDVLLALGALPDPEADASGPPLGRECAGRVVAVGDGVRGIEPGDEVIALATRCFGTHALAPASLAVPRPPALGAEDAVTIPLAFLTAHHALHHVARLRRGERVLLHAAAGGVGLAAVQIAQRAGAEIFATAGSEEKRAYLRSLGVHHASSSRDLSFAGEILDRTGGQGVDVVLNSLAGDFIPASLELLREDGRFIEIGKRDYEADRRIGLRPFLRRLTFALVDLRGMIRDRPGEVRALFEEVMELFSAGALRPLPRRVLPIADAAEALRRMARAEHLGKVVLSLEGAPRTPIAPARAAPPRIAPDRTYLITGGLGGIGLRLARWLVAEGARHLVLVGRGGPSAAAEAAVASLQAHGAGVTVAQADVAVRADVAAVLDRIDRTLPPLGGVVHAAGVLDDGAITRLDRERVGRVFSPKVVGAWHLHELTRGRPLDLFVLCSSALSLLGSPGQASYTAANAFLDALAHHRRALGLPALSINWGTWTEVGLAAAQANRGDRMAARGLEGLSPDEGARAFGELLRYGVPQRAAMRLNPRRWQELHLAAARSRFLSEIGEGPSGAAASGQGGGSLRAALLALPPDERPARLRDHLRDRIAGVLRCDPSRIGDATPLQQAGLESLMAMELRNRIEVDLGIALNVTLIWRHPTVSDLADYLGSELGPPPDAPPAGGPPPARPAPPPALPASGAPPGEPAAPPAPTPADAAPPGDSVDRIARLLRALKKASSGEQGG